MATPAPTGRDRRAARGGRGAEARARAERLCAFASGAAAVPILIHNDPDPDAVASAFAVQALLQRREDRAPIVTLEGITRPENRRMMELLHLRVTEVRAEELYAFERVIVVDSQPRGLDPSRLRRLAVIDHHPVDDGYQAEITDIRPLFGACASILTEYLRALDDRRIGRPLATALLYGIKTDTDNLTRGVTPADVRAYAFLQARADLELVHRIERPMYSVGLLRTFGRAIAAIAVDDGVAATWAGALEEEDAHLLAELADLCLSIEGVCWVVVGGVVADQVVLTVRHLGEGAGGVTIEGGAGGLAHRLAGEVGQGGGHGTMARATWPRSAADQRLFAPSISEAAKLLLRRVRSELEGAGNHSS